MHWLHLFQPNDCTKRFCISLQTQFFFQLHKKFFRQATPIARFKAVKNKTEAEGLKNCHIRDGVALCKYFAWLENAINNGEYVTEISGATKLEEFRK